MKVVIDLIGVNQNWNPDTGEQVNTAHLMVGKEELLLNLTEDQLQALIATGAKQRIDHGLREYVPSDDANYEAEPDPEELPLNAEGERVFGGDMGELRHTLFQEINTDDIEEPARAPVVREKSSTQQRLDAIQGRVAATPSGQRMDAKAQMRARAARVPPTRVAKDDLGYPIVAKPTTRRDVEAPVVVERAVHTSVENADDLFDQG